MSDMSRDLAALRIDRSEPKSRRKLPGWLGWLVVAGGLTAAAALAAPAVKARVFKPEVSATEIAMVSPAEAQIDLTSTGYVVPQTVAKVGSKVVGRVRKVGVVEGGAVKEGNVLFELDPLDQKSALAGANAKVSSANARVAAARARAAAARASADEVKTQLERTRKLVDAGAAAGTSAEDLELRLKGLLAQVAVADADAAAAMADASSAKVDVGVFSANLDAMTIAAPIDGTATTKPAEIGDVVSPGVTLVELADLRTLVVETDVPEARLSVVKVGGPCEVVLDAYPDKRLRGEVREILPKLNRSKATGTVRVKVLDASVTILPEMAARVSFLQKALEQKEMAAPPKKVVAATAIVDRGGRKYVFVLDGGKIQLRSVTVGPAFGSGLELTDGPPPGTRVVDKPASTLTDGQAVKEGTP